MARAPDLKMMMGLPSLSLGHFFPLPGLVRDGSGDGNWFLGLVCL